MQRNNMYVKGFLVSCILLAAIAHAEEREYTAAVQERLYQEKHAFTVWGGYVPDEDFTINYPLSLGYQYHFNKHLAWETIRGSYFLSQPRKLQTQLIDDYGIAPSDFDYPLYSAFSSLVLKPSYGKDSIFNRFVLNHETHLSVGGGLTSFLKEYNYGSNTEELAWSVRLAAARKYYLNSHFALNLELEETFAFKEEGVTNNFAISAGLTFQFSFKKNVAQENEELKLLYQYIGSDNEE
jgi:outer membrane beta-barrel protein